MNWYSYCNENPIAFVDKFGLETVGISMEGITYHKLDNVEDKNTGMYASLRSIARVNRANVDFKLNDNGSAIVNYTIVDKSIGGIYGHRIEIKFNNFKEGEYASSVRVFCIGDNGEFEVTSWTDGRDNVATVLTEQENYFYIKKDENSDNLVVNAKVTAMSAASNNRKIGTYFANQWLISGIIAKEENLDRQKVLNMLWYKPLLKIDVSNVPDVLKEWKKVYHE